MGNFLNWSKKLAIALGQGPLNPVAVVGPAKSCTQTQLSCHATFPVDTCCLNSPGGQLLQTQFWDFSPAIGPSDSWTIHGLWPDLCDGTYEANCDPPRAYKNISDILNSFGRDKLLSYMNKMWLSLSDSPEELWEHEWAKHGTCVSTLDPKCFSDYVPTQEIVDYFERTVELFQGLNTYEILADSGIVPSESATYKLSDIQKALSTFHKHPVTIRCRSGNFNEVWYHFNVKGSLQSGIFVAAEPDGVKSSCPPSGIRYLPKQNTRSK